jgi:Arm domain-containing DNA-binding protein
MTKLTKQSLPRLKPRAKPYIEYDSDLPGFGVAVYPSGIKSWVCEYRPHGGGRGVAKKRVTLGKTSQLTPEQARKAAGDMLATVRLGGDPAQEKLERRASVTVGELIDLFDSQYVGPMLKPRARCSEGDSIDPRPRHRPSFPHGRSPLRCQPCRRRLVKGFRMGGRRWLDP